VLLEEIARTSADVAATSARSKKVEGLAATLSALGQAEVGIAVSYLSGELPQGSIGVGWATLRDLPPPATEPSLELLDVDTAVRRIAVVSGKGSQAVRAAEVRALFERATEIEQRFLRGLFLGELRQGALEGVMLDAVAKAADAPVSDLRRAAMLAGDLSEVATAALREGADGLERFSLTLLRPVQPMLAQTAADVASALERVGEAAVEWKLDGARLQVHRLNDEVCAFTRNLADITDRVPEVVDAVRALRVDAIVLDGEAIALREDGRPHPFQVTMSRFGTRTNERTGGSKVPMSAFFFDCLHLNGEDLLGLPARARWNALERGVPEELRVPRIETADARDASRFLDEALERGHEGVMVKSLDSLYEAGRRGGSWLKVKVAKTLDLVVLAAEWGHGRREGRLSNLHLGARDPEGGYVMLGKTFKGMTDAMLEWQTERLLELEERRDAQTVYVRPELVVEVAFDGVQSSSRYPGGVALRFARVKGYRPDKSAQDADTIDAVRAVHAGEPVAGLRKHEAQ
jgi:DNA ligase-1